MQNRKLVVFCNLKPRNIQGVDSIGMVLCAESLEANGSISVSPLDPPASSVAGSLIHVKNYSHEFRNASNSKLGKAWKAVQPEILVKDDKKAYYRDSEWTVNNEPVVCDVKGLIR